jgi:DHA1 family tetracycline resistance protein-like MFS transporter
VRVPARYVVVLGFVGFVTSFGAHIVTVNLPVYAKTVGIGTAVIGLLIASYDFAEIIAKPAFGWISDSQGMKRTMLAGIVIFILASLSYLLVPPELLIVVRFLQGVGAAALSAVSLALVGTYYKEKRGQAYGIYNAIKGAGYVVSPVVGGLIILKSHFSTIFVAAAVVGVAALLLSLSLPSDRDMRDRATDIGDGKDDDLSVKALMSVFREPALRRWYGVIVINMFFVGILFGFLPVRIHALHYTPVASGVLLSVVALSYLLVQPLAGRVADMTNTAATVEVGLLVSAASTIVVAFVSGIPFVAACILSGVGIGVVWTNTDALVSRLADQNRLGATMGAAGSFKELGDMVGPLFIGGLSQAFGLSVGFLICGLLGLASVALIHRG